MFEVRRVRVAWLRLSAAIGRSLALLLVLALGGPRVPSRALAFAVQREVRSQIIERLTADLAVVRSTLETAVIPVHRRVDLRARLAEAEREIGSIAEPDLASFTTVLPLNPTHARILGVHGATLAARGLAPLVVWKTHRYDAVPFLAVPPSGEGAQSIDIVVMKGEYRADAILLTNATDQPTEAQLQLSGVPGSRQPDWLRVSGVEWTDTKQRTPVADALPDAPFTGGTYRVTVPAGMTRKVWLTLDGSKLAPGTYHGTLGIRSGRASTGVPVTFRVSRVTMGRPRLSLGTWDYTDGKGRYAITPQNRTAAISLMQSHFVDSPWASPDVLPWPKAADFDATGALAHPLDFRALDDWIGLWPDARRYYVYAKVESEFAGATMNTPEFASRVGAWGRAIAEHVTSLRLSPQRLGLLLVDEPYLLEQNAVIVAWGRVLKAAAPAIVLFEDPNWPRPDRVSPSDAFTLVDELCLHLGIYSRGGERVARYFDERRVAGQRLWVYQTSGPVRLLDPTQYFRLQAWHAFRIQAVGMGFWSFGDTGGADTSWNDYAATGTKPAFAPAFIGRLDATDSVHWQAVREGVEDYEYLAMLRDAAGRTADTNRTAEALALIGEALAELAGPYIGEWPWNRDPAHARPDEYRLRMLSLLESSRPH